MELAKAEIITRLKALENDHKKQFAPQQKSVEKARKLREEGNRTYVNCHSEKDFQNVYKLYAQSIAHAPANSQEIALAYSNLSAVLLRLEKYSECLQAIDCCLNSGYPEKSKFKIYLRKIECLKIVGKTVKAKEAYVEALAWLEQNETDAKQKTDMKKKLQECHKKNVKVKKPFTEKEYREVWRDFSIKKYSEEIQGASDAVCLKYSEALGRHYVATRDIRPGEIVMEHRQYLLVVAKAVRYQYCWMCGKFMANCIPCDSCNDVIFCSVECKDDSWKRYHSLECEQLSLLMNLPVSEKLVHTTILMAFRALFLGTSEYGSFENLRKVVEEFDQSSGTSSDPRTEGFTNGQLRNDKYLGFYSLKGHHNFITHFKIIKSVVGAIFDAATTTNLFRQKFEPNSKLCEDEDIVFAARLVLRHTDIVDTNSFESQPLPFDTTHTGMTVSILESLFNHSCVRNVGFTNNPTYNAGIAMLPIKKGEQLYVTYFDGETVAEKQRKSMLQYRFTCNCIACKEKWPSLFKYSPLQIKNPQKNEVIYAEVISKMPPTFDYEPALRLLTLTSTGFSDRKFMVNCLKFYSKLLDKFVEAKIMPCADVYITQDTMLGLNNYLNNRIIALF